LEAVKHNIRKYVKREKRKELAEPETTYWDFDCKIGLSAETAECITYQELFKALEKIQTTGAEQVYVEILVKRVTKPLKVPEDVPSRETSVNEESDT